VVEIAWLTATTWVLRAELLGLGVVALWWYVVAFNEVPPIDYAGLWHVSSFAIALDAIVAAALVIASQTLLRRRA
jgi:membrane protein implicated in regulation of membrane protease activity